MNLAERFTVHFDHLASSTLGAPALLPTRLATAAAQSLTGSSAVGLSLFTSRLRVPIGTSSKAAAVAQQLQFSFGEGPCYRAYHTAQPVWAYHRYMTECWPIFAAQMLARTPFQAIASVPLTDGMADLGTVDIYFSTDQDMTDQSVDDVMQLTALVSSGLLDQSPRVPAPAALAEPPWLDGPAVAARFLVPVALGMTSEQTGRDFPTAMALLRARAFSETTTMDRMAADVVSRGADLTDDSVMD